MHKFCNTANMGLECAPFLIDGMRSFVYVCVCECVCVCIYIYICT